MFSVDLVFCWPCSLLTMFSVDHVFRPRTQEISEQLGGKTLAQIAINWCICKGVVPIPGVFSPCFLLVSSYTLSQSSAAIQNIIQKTTAHHCTPRPTPSRCQKPKASCWHCRGTRVATHTRPSASSWWCQQQDFGGAGCTLWKLVEGVWEEWVGMCRSATPGTWYVFLCVSQRILPEGRTSWRTYFLKDIVLLSEGHCHAFWRTLSCSLKDIVMLSEGHCDERNRVMCGYCYVLGRWLLLCTRRMFCAALIDMECLCACWNTCVYLWWSACCRVCKLRTFCWWKCMCIVHTRVYKGTLDTEQQLQCSQDNITWTTNLHNYHENATNVSLWNECNTHVTKAIAEPTQGGKSKRIAVDVVVYIFPSAFAQDVLCVYTDSPLFSLL